MELLVGIFRGNPGDEGLAESYDGWVFIRHIHPACRDSLESCGGEKMRGVPGGASSRSLESEINRGVTS